MIKEAIIELSKKHDLDAATAEAVMDEIMRGDATSVQMSAYLTALALKGETIEEITGSAAGMRRHCIKLLHDMDVLEIMGTGGVGTDSFNISTTSSIVVAGAGVPVAKHGKRSSRGGCGSADLFEALGADISIPPERSSYILKKIGLCFLFSQNYHIAMRYVTPIRNELGIRTIFNILGPLANPAGAGMVVMGVYDADLVEPLAKVLTNLGVKRAMVVHGEDGLDEISMSAPTRVCEVKDGFFRSYSVDPRDYGLELCLRDALLGGTAEENALLTRRILSGETDKTIEPKRNAVLLNSAAALYTAGECDDIGDGIKLAAEVIDSGAALDKLDRFIKLSNEE